MCIYVVIDYILLAASIRIMQILHIMKHLEEKWLISMLNKIE